MLLLAKAVLGDQYGKQQVTIITMLQHFFTFVNMFDILTLQGAIQINGRQWRLANRRSIPALGALLHGSCKPNYKFGQLLSG